MKQSNGPNNTIAQVQQKVVQLTNNSRIGQLKDTITGTIQKSCLYIHIHSMTQQFLKLPHMDLYDNENNKQSDICLKNSQSTVFQYDQHIIRVTSITVKCQSSGNLTERRHFFI